MSFANIVRESGFTAGSGAAANYALVGAQVLAQPALGRTGTVTLANVAPLYPAGAVANGTANVACPSIGANSVIVWSLGSGSAALAAALTITRTAGAGFSVSTGAAGDNAKTLTYHVIEAVTPA